MRCRIIFCMPIYYRLFTIFISVLDMLFLFYFVKLSAILVQFLVKQHFIRKKPTKIIWIFHTNVYNLMNISPYQTKTPINFVYSMQSSFPKLQVIYIFLFYRVIKNLFFLFQYVGGPLNAQDAKTSRESMSLGMFFTWQKLGRNSLSILIGI